MGKGEHKWEVRSLAVTTPPPAHGAGLSLAQGNQSDHRWQCQGEGHTVTGQKMKAVVSRRPAPWAQKSEKCWRRGHGQKCGRLGSEITGVNLPCCSACHLHVCLALGSVSYSGVPRSGLGAGLIFALKELQPGPQVWKAALSPNLGPPDWPTWPLRAVERPGLLGMLAAGWISREDREERQPEE